MKDFERIKKNRNDMSDYVLHCTRNFSTLKKILDKGVFKATFAITRTPKTPHPTIEGPHKAICFTAQPLQFFIKSIQANYRYTKFAIALRKDDLFYYGGRPIIYSDEDFLQYLPDDFKYLWGHYDPNALWEQHRNYPIDWTHEREWRARPNVTMNKKVGISSEAGLDISLNEVIPVHMPNKEDYLSDTDNYLSKKPNFVILVDEEERKQDLIKWISDNVDRIRGRGNYWNRYSISLARALGRRILSIEEITSETHPVKRIEEIVLV
jgi:hypothetical protein